MNIKDLGVLLIRSNQIDFMLSVRFKCSNLSTMQEKQEVRGKIQDVTNLDIYINNSKNTLKQKFNPKKQSKSIFNLF